MSSNHIAIWQLDSTTPSVNPGSDPEVLEVSVMPTIEMAVFGLASAEDHRRIAPAMMCFPLATARIGATISPNQHLPATLTSASGLFKGPFNFLGYELIVISHAPDPPFLSDRPQSALA
jgi:hypothetical protein